MARIDGGKMVVRALEREGVRQIFSISGGHIAPIYDALIDSDISLEHVRHEQAAVMMADAWGRLTDTPGVALVTAGPGFTNTITGIANARLANAPVVLISGAVATDMVGRLDLQELPQIEVITPLVKWAERVTDTGRITESVHEAFHHARTGNPGPVYLEIPANVLGGSMEEGRIETSGPRPRLKPAGAPEQIERAVELLAGASKPVVIGGTGVWYARAMEDLVSFIEQSGIPAFTTSFGKGTIPDDHPFCFGPAFGVRPGATIAALIQADVLMLIGTRISLFFAHGKIFNPNARIIQATIDPEEIGRNRRIELGIVGDAGEVLKQMKVAAKGKLKPENYKDWRDQLEGSHKLAMAVFRKQMESDQVPIHPVRLCRDLDQFLGDDDILAVDGGDTSVWMGMTRNFRRAGCTLESGLFGCLGVGIPYGVAAKMAFPARKVAVIIGDGSVGFNFFEFGTAVRAGLPIVVVINNDMQWGMVRHSQELRYGKDRTIGVDLGMVPYHKMVESLGGYGEEVTKPEDIRPALERAFGSGKPALVNVITERDIISPGSHALAAIGRKADISEIAKSL
jgi:acetolactate synthase-1/2/3 large subunit